MKGTVKWFNNKKGYGFITGEDKKDYFFHYSQIRMQEHNNLFKGGRVYFEVSEQDKNNRVQAIDVKPILTLAMVKDELSKEGLHLIRIHDDKGIHGWYMDLIELVAYTGFSISKE